MINLSKKEELSEEELDKIKTDIKLKLYMYGVHPKYIVKHGIKTKIGKLYVYKENNEWVVGFNIDEQYIPYFRCNTVDDIANTYVEDIMGMLKTNGYMNGSITEGVMHVTKTQIDNYLSHNKRKLSNEQWQTLMQDIHVLNELKYYVLKGHFVPKDDAYEVNGWTAEKLHKYIHKTDCNIYSLFITFEFMVKMVNKPVTVIEAILEKHSQIITEQYRMFYYNYLNYNEINNEKLWIKFMGEYVKGIKYQDAKTELTEMLHKSTDNETRHRILTLLSGIEYKYCGITIDDEGKFYKSINKNIKVNLTKLARYIIIYGIPSEINKRIIECRKSKKHILEILDGRFDIHRNTIKVRVYDWYNTLDEALQTASYIAYYLNSKSLNKGLGYCTEIIDTKTLKCVETTIWRINIDNANRYTKVLVNIIGKEKQEEQPIIKIELIEKKRNRDKNAYDELVDYAYKVLTWAHDEYSDPYSTPGAYVNILLGIGMSKVESRPGAGHNYQAVMDAIYRLYTIDDTVKEAFCEGLECIIKNCKEYRTASLICDYICYHVKKVNEGIAPFSIQHGTLMEKLEEVTNKNIDIMRNTTPEVDSWLPKLSKQYYNAINVPKIEKSTNRLDKADLRIYEKYRISGLAIEQDNYTLRILLLYIIKCANRHFKVLEFNGKAGKYTTREDNGLKFYRELIEYKNKTNLLSYFKDNKFEYWDFTLKYVLGGYNDVYMHIIGNFSENPSENYLTIIRRADNNINTSEIIGFIEQNVIDYYKSIGEQL